VLTAFWSGLGSEFAKQWVARVLTPAFVFWTAGLAIVWWSANRDGVEERGLSAQLAETARPLEELPTAGQVIVIAGALILLAASALVADRLTVPVLKLLEGYGPMPRGLRRRLAARRWRRREALSTAVNELRARRSRGDLSLQELDELNELRAQPQSDPARLKELTARSSTFTAGDAVALSRGEARLRSIPPSEHLVMPTRLGDILRAAEFRPGDKYGLDTTVCWYSLWLLLPAEVKQEISQARLELDRAARAWLWGALFLVWTPWLFYVALPVGILIPLLAYYVGMLNAARLFGDLMETAFDLHRMTLYDALHLPRPTSAADERAHGALVTRLLWQGETDPRVVYVADGG
jgi:hypothetical protein